MRSTKIKLSVVCVVGSLLTLSAVLATGAGAAAPVGSGTASTTKSVCGLGTGKKATGKPIKIAEGERRKAELTVIPEEN